MRDFEQPEPPLHVVVNDPLAMKKNIATNGRLYCAMIFVAALYNGFPMLAVFAAIPVGMACIVDQLPDGKGGPLLSLLNYVATITVTIILLWNLG